MSSTPPTGANPPSSPTFSVKNVLLASLLPITIILGWMGYLYLNAKPENTGEIDVYIGLADRIKGDRTKLSDDYTDADGDLLADAPTDAAKRLNPTKLVIAPVASPEAPELKPKLQALLDHIAKVTNKEVQYEALTDTNQQITNLKEGKLHITAMNTGLVPSAVNLAGFVPYCAPTSDGKNYAYEMLLITPADSPIDSPEKIKGSRLAVTTINSHSGYKMPLVYLREAKNLLAGKDYEIVITGGHFQTIDGVLNKSYPVGAIASDLLERSIAEGKLKETDVRIIYRSGPSFPVAPWGYSSQLDPELVKKIHEAFDTFAGPPKFTPVNYQKDWEPIRKVDQRMLNWTK